MEATLAEAPCLCFAVAHTGLLLDANDRLCQLLGYDRQELIGQKLERIYTLSSRIFYETHLFPLLKLHGFADEIYLTLQTKDKQALPVLINAERKGEGENAIIQLAGIVVYNRKKFEEELVAARKAAEAAMAENTELVEAKKREQLHAEELDRQMQKTRRQNEELKLFNRVVTHDLQEPLRKLLLFTGLLLEKENLQTNNDPLNRIASATTQMRSIVAGLQQYVWLTDTPIKLAAVNLNEVLKSASTKLAQEHQDLILSLSTEELPVIAADLEQIRFLFEEILGNALRFRKPGNEVKVSVSASKLLQNQFKSVPGHYKYVDYLKLDITDDGLGMDSTYKDQALELFKRLHPNSGRGVGLSLCKKIVENHGGSLVLHSKEGKGTTVTLRFPLFEEQSSSVISKVESSQK